MAVNAFERLSRELTPEQRHEMLQKISEEIALPEEPLSQEDLLESKSVDLVAEYEKLGFFAKILLWFRALIKQEDRYALLEMELIRRLAREVQSQYKEGFSASGNILLQGFHDDISALEEAVRPLRAPLAAALGTDKASFIAFLASTELEVVHERLLHNYDPWQMAEDHPEFDIKQLKHEIDYRLEDLLESIPERERNTLYLATRQCEALHKLSNYNFDAVNKAFRSALNKGEAGCPAKEIKDNLMVLADIFATIFPLPDLNVLQSLFLFWQYSSAGDGEVDILHSASEDIRIGVKGITGISEFRQEVPLEKIIAVAIENIYYHPQEPKGGEDWFSLYRNFWQKRKEKLFSFYKKDQTRKELLSEAAEFIKSTTLPRLSYYTADNFEEKIELKHEISLAFLKGFLEIQFFPIIYSPIKKLHIDGEFYKPQNRAEFTDAFNVFSNLLDNIQELEKRLKEDGDLGKSIQSARNEMTVPSVRLSKIRNVLSSADRTALEILQRALENTDVIIHVIHGILYGEVGGRFDTLSNLGYIGGQENSRYLSSLDKVMKICIGFRDLLNRILDLENGVDT